MAAGEQPNVRGERARDAYDEAIVATCRALDDWRSGRRPAPNRFLDYIAVTAYRACRRMRNAGVSVVYLLMHQPGLALWHARDHLQVGGYRVWRDEGRALASARADRSAS